MPLNAILENLDSLDEKFHELYEEKEGKYILSVTGVEKHPAVTALQNALNRLKDERRKFLADLKVRDYQAVIDKLSPLPDDFDLDEYNEMKARVAELEEENTNLKEGKGGDDEKKRQEELTKLREKLESKYLQLQTKMNDMVAAKDKELEDMRSRLRRTVADKELEEQLDRIKVKPALRKAAKAVHRDDIVVEEGEDGNYKTIVKTDLGEITLAEYIDSWASSEDGKEFVEKMKGSGADNSDKDKDRDVNPWKKETRNLTMQGNIIKKDKAKARQMMKAAGVDDAKIRLVLGEAAQAA
jgi:G:T/U-mismatch repair DNA glycosylase